MSEMRRKRLIKGGITGGVAFVFLMAISVTLYMENDGSSSFGPIFLMLLILCLSLAALIGFTNPSETK